MPLTGDAKRAYQVQWISNRRNAWIESQGGVCNDCGSNTNLEVDHIDRTTKSCNPARLWSRSLAFREAELAKCQVLCEDCHKAKSIAEMTVDHPHGTYARYRRGCKCDACTATVAPYWKEYRARKK